MTTRRRFLRTTLLGALVLGTAGLLGRQLGRYPLPGDVAARLRALSAKEYVVLCALVRRLVATDGPDAPSPDAVGAALFIDQFLAGVEAGPRSDVKALLQLVEHGGAFSLSMRRFTQLDAAAQDAALAAWETSGLALRRYGFQALRTLAFMGYWRDERTWPLIGYTGPTVRR